MIINKALCVFFNSQLTSPKTFQNRRHSSSLNAHHFSSICMLKHIHSLLIKTVPLYMQILVLNIRYSRAEVLWDKFYFHNRGCPKSPATNTKIARFLCSKFDNLIRGYRIYNKKCTILAHGCNTPCTVHFFQH